MKRLNFKLLSTVSLMAVLLFSSCADLVVENKNDPSQSQVITSADDVTGLVQGAWEVWALYSQAYQSAPLHVQADWYTATVGNWWVNDAGHEVGPIDGQRERLASYPNTPTTSYPEVVNFHWTYYYRALFNVNTAIGIIDAGNVVFPSEAAKLQLKATAQLLQGIIYGTVGLIFDRGYTLDENTDLSSLQLENYQDVIAAAVAKLEDAKTTADAANAAGSAGVSETIIPLLGSLDSNPAAGAIDWTEFKQIANTYAASFLAQYPRTSADAVDWEAVYTYASAGIDFDFAPHSDDNNWIPYLIYYMNNDWFRVDMKIVNKLDPNQPKYWPTTDGQNGVGPDAPHVVSADARFGTDYVEAYDAATDSYPWGPFNPARGYYKRSHVVYDRYSHFLTGVWTDPLPLMMRAQNNLLIAEAELNRTGGNIANAVAMINDTRVGRGNLPPLTVADPIADIREALEYEWDIEVAISGVSTLSPWYNKRRWGQLLKGSMLHLPVPAGELGIIQEDYYTFGGGGEGSAPKLNIPSIDTENRRIMKAK